jgi:hypothetical protein
MPRTRNIKPGFFENEELTSLTPLERLLFAGLWCWADREGRLEDRPRRIKTQILAYEDRCDINKMLDNLQNSPGNFIARYEANGSKYIQINNFRKHQHCHVDEQKSVIPAPEMHRACTVLAPGNCDKSPEAISLTASSLHASSEVLVPPKSPKGDLEFPSELDSPQFREAWIDWEQHRKEKKKPITPTSRKRAMKRLAPLGIEMACHWINNAIAQGWQGIYDPSGKGLDPDKPVESVVLEEKDYHRYNPTTGIPEYMGNR